MKSVFISAIIASAAMAPAPAMASAGFDLAKKSNCLACHTEDNNNKAQRQPDKRLEKNLPKRVAAT